MEGGGGGTMAVALQSGRGGAMISFSAFRCLIPKRFFFIKPSSSSSSPLPPPPCLPFSAFIGWVDGSGNRRHLAVAAATICAPFPAS